MPKLPVTLSTNPASITEGGVVTLTATHGGPASIDPTTVTYQWTVENGKLVESPGSQDTSTVHWDTTGLRAGSYSASVTVSAQDREEKAYAGTDAQPIVVTVRPIASGDTVPVTMSPPPLSAGDTLSVTMKRAAEAPTSDAALWVAIRYSANQLSFQNYVQFVDTVMCNNAGDGDGIDSIIESYLNPNAKPGCLPPLSERRFLPFPNMDAYRVLKVATECFLMLNCGVYLTQGALSNLVGVTASTIAPPAFPKANYDLYDDANRLSQSASTLPPQIVQWWNTYLASGNQFLELNDPQGVIIPYLALVRSRLSELPLTKFCDMGIQCYGILRSKLTHPCLIELIWSYWHEEAMLVQTLNAVSRRFQNLRGAGDRDPLVRFDIDPLRRLNSLLWGYVGDEQHRLTVVRRAYEYNHEYGLTLEGKAVRLLRPSDSRSKFLEAFHNLLYLCTIFFKEDDDTTVVADGFPVLNALKEVHYILAAGAHNQFGELPSTARQEMLMQEWLLARPEMREFLGGKIMVPYPEEWMDRVDNVKSMEGWSDVSVIHFHDLGVYGEQIVLSVRYGAWSLPTATAAQAANWARYWRNEIQGYIHAYRAVTGVDLTTEPVNSTLPSVLLLKRLAAQRPVAR
jgi:hypothetical protein